MSFFVRSMAFFERFFWILVLLTCGLGILLPFPGERLGAAIAPILMLMLFLACLKIPLRAIGVHFRRPLLLGWLLLLAMILTPLLFYGATLLVLPAFAVGIFIVVAMPGGMMNSSITDICGGDGSLALVGTGLTTLLCPVTVPLLLYVIGVQPENASAGGSGAVILLKQAAWLSLFVFIPPLLAAGVRRAAPKTVERLRPSIGGLTILCLIVLVYIALARFSEGLRDPKNLQPVLLVLAWLFAVSGVLYLIGYFLGGARKARERTALAVNVAYMNNLLGLVFAMEFFGERLDLVLPAILIEFPMHVWLAPLRRLGRRAVAREEQQADPPAGKEEPDDAVTTQSE